MTWAVLAAIGVPLRLCAIGRADALRRHPDPLDTPAAAPASAKLAFDAATGR